MIEKDKDLTLLTYGLADFNKQAVEIVIAAQYGFKFRTVSGCLVSDSLKDSVAIENRFTEDTLAQKYGKAWRFRFYADVDSLYKKQLRFCPQSNSSGQQIPSF